MRVGKNLLVRRLAVGGMAQVFLAKQIGIVGFEKRVVLKSILPQHANDDSFVGMFLNEARLAASLDHPNIVQIYDIGSKNGGYYFTMEYCRGADLRSILRSECRRKKHIPLGCAVSIGLGVAAGLHYAHEKHDDEGRHLGIIHRDVSLSNILVSYDGAVKVADFGIAKVAAHEAQTKSGVLKGKVAYMSPEQVRGHTLDRRSDIFSIGIVLYELTTGTRLFKSKNEFSLMEMVTTGTIEKPSRRRAHYPPQLETIVMRALSRDRNERYSTAQELQVDLEAFARETKLTVSSVALADYMRTLFEDKIKAEPPDAIEGPHAEPRVARTPRSEKTALISNTGRNSPPSKLSVVRPTNLSLAGSGPLLGRVFGISLLALGLVAALLYLGGPTEYGAASPLETQANAAFPAVPAGLAPTGPALNRVGKSVTNTASTAIGLPLVGLDASASTSSEGAPPVKKRVRSRKRHTKRTKRRASKRANKRRSRRWHSDSALPPGARGH